MDNIEPEAMALLRDYDYQGKLRGLNNLIERGVVLGYGSELMSAQLPPTLAERAIHVVRVEGEHLPTLEERETEYIRWALYHTSGNRTRVAEIPGIDRVSLWCKLKAITTRGENQPGPG